jgi:hypothetical protein
MRKFKSDTEIIRSPVWLRILVIKVSYIYIEVID